VIQSIEEREEKEKDFKTKLRKGADGEGRYFKKTGDWQKELTFFKSGRKSKEITRFSRGERGRVEKSLITRNGGIKEKGSRESRARISE